MYVIPPMNELDQPIIIIDHPEQIGLKTGEHIMSNKKFIGSINGNDMR